MKRKIVYAFGICAICLIGIFGYRTFSDKRDVNPLNGDWQEVNVMEGFNPYKLTISADKVTLTTDYAVTSSSYTTKEEDGNMIIEALPHNCVYMLYHTQNVDDSLIHIISMMEMEYDGRGLIVCYEFVKEEDVSKVPSDFRSDLMKEYNDREAIPTYIEVD